VQQTPGGLAVRGVLVQEMPRVFDARRYGVAAVVDAEHPKAASAYMSPLPAGRSAGGCCQVVGAGPRPPGLGRNWAQTGAQGGWLGAGPAGGKGAAASQRLLFYQEKISADFRARFIYRVRGTADRLLVYVGKTASER
jgi:hypothetical protein